MVSNNKKLFLIFHGRFPSNKAASLFVAKSSEAFAEEGIEVVLLVPRRIGRDGNNPYDYYQIRRNFQTVYLPVVDIGTVNFLDSLRFILSFVSFSVASFLYLLARARRGDIIYSNETMPLFLASFAFTNTFYEMHDFPKSKFNLFRFFLKRIRWVLIHNIWKMEQVKKLFHISGDKIICEPNAVDISEFDIPISKEEARHKLNISPDKKVIVYTGHLYEWKGVYTLAQAVSKLPEEYEVFFVGGTTEDISAFKKKYGKNLRIKIVGFFPHKEIPIWQKAADVLVLPNTGKEDISRYYTSPMKLFEYAASRRPIVATKIPSTQELLNDNRVFFVEPDNAGSLAEGIKLACLNNEKSTLHVNAAYLWVSEHTWEKRAKRIIRFMI